LKVRELEKIKSEAILGGDDGWAFQVEFQTASGNKKFAVIDWQEYLDYREMLEKNGGTA
jgi:hypothetical protein